MFTAVLNCNILLKDLTYEIIDLFISRLKLWTWYETKTRKLL